MLEAFRAGAVNTLICTCIGEEGIDVGEVDLIVHYDTVTSAIRNIQVRKPPNSSCIVRASGCSHKKVMLVLYM